MKRFLLFAGSSYYPDGGFGDFQGSFDTEEEIKIVEKYYEIRPRSWFPQGKRGDNDHKRQLKPKVCGYLVNEEEFDWYQIIDANTVD